MKEEPKISTYKVDKYVRNTESNSNGRIKTLALTISTTHISGINSTHHINEVAYGLLSFSV